MINFASFFKAIHGFEPFPWQKMLAKRVLAEGRWPKLIDLPTASGKTACIDIAVWAMGCEAGKPPAERKMPRRIWFVVDRRIVVDEAAKRAADIQQALLEQPLLSEIAEALRGISHTTLPLAVERLRGGGGQEVRGADLPNDAWQHVPSQPAVITSTIDQLGSRLLFRGYGIGRSMWPIHAALAGNDSLILLDEAHIAEPMRQTLVWVEKHRCTAQQPIATPWQFSVMTATPEKVEADGVFPRPDERQAALNHDLLRQRQQASKPAKMVLVEKPTGKTRKPETLVPEAVEEVKRCLGEKRQRIAVMVNRVDTALAIEAALLQEKALGAEVRLLTGRMRPVDRKSQLDDLTGKLLARHGGQAELDRPIVLVTTQCLEVGADFDFDGLVTECASFDTLRQRFGRLDRLGQQPGTTAAILAWQSDVEAGDDPIYGPGLAATWQWLTSMGDVADFGINALPQPSDPAALLAPKPRAPVLMPAYLDAWCQREPAVEADVSLFLHGIRDSDPEVSVVFRADLAAEDISDEALADAVRLLPPQAGEMLPVRLGRLLGWLAGDKKVPADTDLAASAGEDVAAAEASDPPHRLVRYRGRRSGETRTLSTGDLRRQLRSGDVVVLPWAQEMPATLGRRADDVPVDCFELANDSRKAARLTPTLIASRATEGHPQSQAAAVGALTEQLQKAMRQLSEPEDEDDEQAGRDALTEMAFDPQIRNGDVFRVVKLAVHPVAGVVLFGEPPKKPVPIDPFGGDDDASFDRREVKLSDHAEQVAEWAVTFAKMCLPQAEEASFRHAGLHHDDGKADPRFQAILRGDNVPLPRPEHDLLAKSGGLMPPPAIQRRQREQLGLPADFRHEMTSLQLAQKSGTTDDLLLHLLASHHGYARPFAPVVLEEDPPDLILTSVAIAGEERLKQPPHALGSGITDRFWRLTRRHGWWGLAYLETILRLADHHASRFGREVNQEAADA